DFVVRSRPWIMKTPREERDAIAGQWRRASYGVVLNIAEGGSRRVPRVFRRDLDFARGSLHEVAVVLDLVPLRRVRDECARTVWGLLRSEIGRAACRGGEVVVGGGGHVERAQTCSTRYGELDDVA